MHSPSHTNARLNTLMGLDSRPLSGTFSSQVGYGRDPSISRKRVVELERLSSKRPASKVSKRMRSKRASSLKGLQTHPPTTNTRLPEVGASSTQGVATLQAGDIEGRLAARLPMIGTPAMRGLQSRYQSEATPRGEASSRGGLGIRNSWGAVLPSVRPYFTPQNNSIVKDYYESISPWTEVTSTWHDSSAAA